VLLSRARRSRMTLPRVSAACLCSRKNLATISSQDALVGVKRTWSLEWRAKQRLAVKCS
jgi:hypothetical protein